MLVCLLLPVVISTGCRSSDKDTNTVVVYAAASLTDVLSEIADEFAGQTGIETEFNFAATSTLARQISLGASPDLFIAADEGWMHLIREKKVVAETSQLTANRLVIVVPKTANRQPKQLEDLVDSHFAKIAMADPDSVPAGIYAKHALEKCGIWQQIKPKAVYGVHVRQALAMVENELADAALVYDTDARISESVLVTHRIDSELTGAISYPVAIMKASDTRKTASMFYNFLKSDNAKQIFREHGFIELDTSGPSSTGSQ